MDAEAADLQHRNYIGFQRVAGHQHGFRRKPAAGEDRGIDRRGLVGHDLHPGEEVAKARLGKLAFLIEKVALGDEQERMALCQPLDRRAGLGQKLDRMGQHLLSGRDDLADDACRHPVPGDVERGLDHREHEALDPEAVVPEVAPLRREQALLQMVARRDIGEKGGKAILRQAEEALVLPERVVGVEGDCVECGHGISPGGVVWRGARARGSAPAAEPFSRPITRLYWGSNPLSANPPRREPLAPSPVTLSDRKEGREHETSVITKTRPKTQRPPLYKVLLLNDDYTPMEFVVHVLERFFGM